MPMGSYGGSDTTDTGMGGDGNDKPSDDNPSQQNMPSVAAPVTITAPVNTAGAPSNHTYAPPTPYSIPVASGSGGGGGSSGGGGGGYKPYQFTTPSKGGGTGNFGTVATQSSKDFETLGPIGVQQHTTEIGDNSLVQNQMHNILSEDSPLMQLSATQGKQQGAASGLLNSSMAAGASQNAMIQNALPIASQDASLYGQANLQDSAYIQQGGLADQAFQHNQGLAGQQFDFNTALSTQEFGQNQQLSHQGYTQDSALSTQNFGQNQQLAEQSFGHNQHLQQMSQAHSASMQSQNNQFNGTQSHLGALATAEQNLMTQIASIETNPSIPPDIKGQQIQALQAAHAQMVAQLNSNYSQTISGHSKSAPQRRASVTKKIFG